MAYSEVVAETPERMEIAVARAQPVDEFDAELERAFVARTKSSSSMSEQLVEQLNAWNGRLADADVPISSNSTSVILSRSGGERLGQRRRGHPACGAAAGDDNVADRLCSCRLLPGRSARRRLRGSAYVLPPGPVRPCAHGSAELVGRDIIDERMIATRNHAVAEQDRHPAGSW